MTISITPEEVEILMLENALREANGRVGRRRRAVAAAQVELSEAVASVIRLEEQIRAKREAYLMRTT